MANNKLKQKKVLLIITFLIALFVCLFAFDIIIFQSLGVKPIRNTLVKLTCFGENKEYIVFGFGPSAVCATTYPDAGKVCSSSQDCLSNLCVKNSDQDTPHCRGRSSDYPLCSSGENTVEKLQKTPNQFGVCD